MEDKGKCIHVVSVLKWARAGQDKVLSLCFSTFFLLLSQSKGLTFESAPTERSRRRRVSPCSPWNHHSVCITATCWARPSPPPTPESSPCSPHPVTSPALPPLRAPSVWNAFPSPSPGWISFSSVLAPAPPPPRSPPWSCTQSWVPLSGPRYTPDWICLLFFWIFFSF